jgi:hypothetical protein
MRILSQITMNRSCTVVNFYNKHVISDLVPNIRMRLALNSCWDLTSLLNAPLTPTCSILYAQCAWSHETYEVQLCYTEVSRQYINKKTLNIP